MHERSEGSGAIELEPNRGAGGEDDGAGDWWQVLAGLGRMNNTWTWRGRKEWTELAERTEERKRKKHGEAPRSSFGVVQNQFEEDRLDNWGRFCWRGCVCVCGRAGGWMKGGGGAKRGEARSRQFTAAVEGTGAFCGSQSGKVRVRANVAK